MGNEQPNNQGNNINRINDKNNGNKQNNNKDALLNLLGNTFLTNDGRQDQTFAKGMEKKKVIGLYFSAHWCGPCRQFTPMLKQVYNEWKKQNYEIEIIFVSGDRDYNEFKSYFQNDHGSWLAIPFQSQKRQSINTHFKVRGIPSLIFLDCYGNLIEQNGRNLVQNQGANSYHVLSQNIPEPKDAAFSGQAHSLKNDNVNKGDTVSMYDYVQAKEAKIFDDGDEVATMQIQLVNGEKKTVKMNMNVQNVGDLFAHIKWLHNPGPFKLLAGFPPKDLKDETVTIKDAQLKGARVTQKKL
eukprot:CAMPEP_0201573960 /NCGR_PEP_ID=MMETSP0190_2-20130828/18103_1 /ASSEMBLY_ACC=CAM_ASM_000263 /TAXON_ID=37353 /ORGANISM="Rosalina sp." /LENGTH=296 /DNA_ID=CAMNT_0048001549 /DNA_START=24 /DNA_END=914 /DNA_ORIENTATION=-